MQGIFFCTSLTDHAVTSLTSCCKYFTECVVYGVMPEGPMWINYLKALLVGLILADGYKFQARVDL